MTLSNLLQDEIKVGTKNSEVAVTVDSIYENLKKYYLKQHRNWYLNQRFVSGDHWSVYNKTLNKIQQLPLHSGEIRRTVNKIRTQVRGVKNFIKRNQPRWKVSPNDSSDESLDEAIKYNKILQDVYEKQGFKSILTDIIVNSLKFSVGVLEASLVPYNDGQILEFWTDDTFDIFIDPEATSMKDARFVLKVIKKSLTSIEGNKNYTINGPLAPDNREGGSDYKNILEKEKFNKQNGLKDFDTILLKEIWLKGKDKDGKTLVRLVTVAGNQVIRVQDTNYTRIPIFLYNPEKQSNSIYSDPWIKDLISLNKSLDKTVSQIETYNQRMLSGKWLVKQGVQVSTITDKGAEIISYKGNVAPSPQPMQPLPNTPFTYASSLERWIEEGGGMREASLGRAPGSLQSGKGLEALQAADASTVSEPIENLENFLSEVGEFVLEVISENQNLSSNVVSGNRNIKYIGSKSENNISGVTIVKPRRVKVEIVPELAYSADAKQELVFKLAESNMIDQKTLLEYLNVSNISDIIDRVKKNKEEEYKEEIKKQEASHQSAGGNGAPEDSASLADNENMKMSAGQNIPDTPRALWLPQHTQLHIAFIKENQDAYQQNKDLFDKHISAEEQYVNQTTPQENYPEQNNIQQ